MAENAVEEELEGKTDDSSSPASGKKKGKVSKGMKISILIGIITIFLFIYQIRKSQSASTTTAATDPQTGYPAGSAQDEAALASLGSAAGSGSSYDSGTGTDTTTGTTTTSDPFQNIDPGTGASYASELETANGMLSTLGTDYAGLETAYSTLASEVTQPSGVTPPGGSVGTTIGPSTITGLSTAQQTALTTTQSNLTKDESLPVSAKNTAAIKALQQRVGQITSGTKAPAKPKKK
jgi:hypothetical protein